MHVRTGLLMAVAILLVGSGAYADQDPLATGSYESWLAREDRGQGAAFNDVYDLAIDVDRYGDVYVTHPYWFDGDFDIVTRKYSVYGNELWETRWDGDDPYYVDPEHPGDIPRAITVAHGNVYVAGQTFRGVARSDNDYIVLCYSDDDGQIRWDEMYDYAQGDDEAYAIAPTAAPCFSAVFVTGESKAGPDDSDNDIATIKCNAIGGAKSWEERYSGPYADYATSIVVEGGCTAYVGGSTYRLSTLSHDYVVVSYSSGGDERWAEPWDGPGHVAGCFEIVRDMDIANDRLYVTGQCCGGIASGLDYGTISLDLDDGDLLDWNTYGGAGDDSAWGIDADDWGYVYVTGEDEEGGNPAFATVKYDTELDQKAANAYPNPARGRDIVVDNCDNSYAAGTRIYDDPNNASSYLTIGYQQHDPVTPGQFDREWSRIEQHQGADDAYRVASYGSWVVYVAGESEGDDGELDVVVAKYIDSRGIGDMNCDGSADIFDIDHFIQAITDPDQYRLDHDGSPYPACDIQLGDCNRDGSVDIFDIDCFVERITGGL